VPRHGSIVAQMPCARSRYNPPMHTAHDTPLISCRSKLLRELEADLLCVLLLSDADDDSVRELDTAVGGAIGRARASGELSGKLHERFFADVSDVSWRCRRVLVVGAGPADAYTQTRARLVAATVGMTARSHRAVRIGFGCAQFAEGASFVQATVEGLLVGAFRDERFKSGSAETPPIAQVELMVAAPMLETARAAVTRGTVLGSAVNLARELSNEPGNLFTPRVFADRAIELVTGSQTTVEVLEEDAIASRKMGLVQGVAQGSAEPPRVIVMRYQPVVETPGPVLGLVGKGVTFDSGGISIKPSAGMDQMKRDMAGGAAVVCAMRAISQLAPPIPVIGIVPAVENMPGGRAIRPGDVLTASNGKRVEVLNTDAEGRLILADSLTLAQELGATHLVDIATLTGACVVALGHHASGLVGSPTSWVETIRATADRAGEALWPLPAFDEYAEQLKSDTADLANIGGRAAGAITAGMFLKAFCGDRPWAHLDIAGTAWHEDTKPYHGKGASGVGVRTLASLPFEAEFG